MNDQIVLREFREEDRLPVEEMIREAWKYDEFCSPGAAARLARVYLNSCLANQTFNRVAVVGLEPAGIIMGKNVRSHKLSLIHI